MREETWGGRLPSQVFCFCFSKSPPAAAGNVQNNSAVSVNLLHGSCVQSLRLWKMTRLRFDSVPANERRLQPRPMATRGDVEIGRNHRAPGGDTLTFRRRRDNLCVIWPRYSSGVFHKSQKQLSLFFHKLILSLFLPPHPPVFLQLPPRGESTAGRISSRR